MEIKRTFLKPMPARDESIDRSIERRGLLKETPSQARTTLLLERRALRAREGEGDPYVWLNAGGR